MWNKPYHDPFWETLLPVQWKVYAEHLLLDKKERSEFFRDVAEYAMAFHNYESVRKVQDAREQAAALEDQQTTDIFLQQVKDLFGKEVKSEDLQEAREEVERSANKVPENAKPIPTTRSLVEEDIIRIKKKD